MKNKKQIDSYLLEIHKGPCVNKKGYLSLAVAFEKFNKNK